MAIMATQETQDTTGHIFTLGAAFALGVGITELISHLRDDYHLLHDWKWASVSYFGARWCGLLTMAGYIALSSIGRSSTFSQCHGVFIFAHVFCALNSVFSASIFWTRCGAVCNWKRAIVVPLAIYGIAISAFSLASSADDFAFKPDDILSSVCIVSMKSTSQSVSRFLFASFDLMVAAVTFYALWYKSEADCWISRILLRDQLIYIAVTMTAYLGLASSFLLTSPAASGFGLLCPSVISVVSCRLFLRLKRKGQNNPRNKTFLQVEAFDQPGIKTLFKSRSQSPSSTPSSNKDAGQMEKRLDHHLQTGKGTSPITAQQSSSTVYLIDKRQDDEDRGRSVGLSDGLFSQSHRTRRAESVPAKPRSSNSSSMNRFSLYRGYPSDGDIEMCQEVLQGDQEGFPRRIVPP